MGVALHHLVAVGQRLLQLAHEEVQRRALVPGLGEVGLHRDDAAECGNRILREPLAHLANALLVQRVHLLVARACPDFPERLLGARSRSLIRVAQLLHQRLRIGHEAHVAQAGDSLAALGGIDVGKAFQRLGARELGLRRPTREEHRGQRRRQQDVCGPVHGYNSGRRFHVPVTASKACASCSTPKSSR
jgi:hypothetical protein